MTQPTSQPPVNPAAEPYGHDAAVQALEGWMMRQGLITPSTPKLSWVVSNYRDAQLVTSSVPQQSSRVYLVHRGRVIGFDPEWTSFDAAYDTLMSPTTRSCVRRP